MKILVIGGGGREHGLVWKLRRSPSVTKVWCAPGNGGIAQDAECVAADTGNMAELASLAERLGADLTVVGPEQPLVLGIADEFARRGLRLLGPSGTCAQLEGSKLFAKRFLDRHAIPAAKLYGEYESAGAARDALRNMPWPLVLKADGLAAGKGVLVTTSREEAASFIDRAMEKREFGEGGARLLMEEALAGQELSFIVLTDGERFVPMAPARDHKRALDDDRGPNTGGMGVYSNDEIISPELEKQILEIVVRPTMASLAADGLYYRGFLYFGLMLTANGPKVLEFNCRMGDPETQAIVPRMDFDLGAVLSATADGHLDPAAVRWKRDASVCVVMASGGYPGAYEAGKSISGLADAASAPEIAVFHAGTKAAGEQIVTAGGRVLGVTATGKTLAAARDSAYRAVGKIRFAGAHYRTDIAQSAAQLEVASARIAGN